MPLCRLEQVMLAPSNPARPFPDWFSMPRDKGWCYYDEKVDLARQVGEWGEVKSLGNEAFTSGLLSGEPRKLGV